MPKSDISQQLQIAQFNLQAAMGELERTRALLDIAVATDTIGTNLSIAVRDAALQNILNTLRPQMQVVETPDLPEAENVVEFPTQEVK